MPHPSRCKTIQRKSLPSLAQLRLQPKRRLRSGFAAAIFLIGVIYCLNLTANFELWLLAAARSRHAIRLAKYFPKLQITALDLGYSALAYAQYQAEIHQQARCALSRAIF